MGKISVDQLLGLQAALVGTLCFPPFTLLISPVLSLKATVNKRGTFPLAKLGLLQECVGAIATE